MLEMITTSVLKIVLLAALVIVIIIAIITDIDVGLSVLLQHQIRFFLVKHKLKLVLGQVIARLHFGFPKRWWHQGIQPDSQGVVEHLGDDVCQDFAVYLDAGVGVDLNEPAFLFTCITEQYCIQVSTFLTIQHSLYFTYFTGKSVSPDLFFFCYSPLFSLKCTTFPWE